MVMQLGPPWSTSGSGTASRTPSAMNEAELSAYCREKGLYPEQVAEWRAACEQANEDRAQTQQMKTARRADEQRIKALERELRQKEKALAETAALLGLRKKAQAIWGESEGE